MIEASSVPIIGRHWALGIPLGWLPPSPAHPTLVGQVFYQDHMITLDRIAYVIWTDALIGRVDFARCGDADYLPPSFKLSEGLTNPRISPEALAVAAQYLEGLHLLWYFDPRDPKTYHTAQAFEVVPQGVPVGRVENADRYRVLHSDGSPALDLDRVSYAIWLQWWREPQIAKATNTVANALGIRRTTAFAQAVATAVAGMHVGLINIRRSRSTSPRFV